MLKYLFGIDDHRVWDLAEASERTSYYELALVHGHGDLLLDSVDGLLPIQAWPDLDLPDVVRAAWQPTR